MSKAAANRSALYYKAETTWGETPAGGAFTQLRFTGESLDRDKKTEASKTIRADRMIDELALLGFNTMGDLNFELSYGSFDTFFEALFGGTWANKGVGTPQPMNVLTGVVERSFVVEKQFQDISEFMYFNGLRVASLDMDFVAKQIITGKFGFKGKNAVASGSTVSGSLVGTSTSKLMTASANVGNIKLNGSALSTGLKSIKLSIKDDLRDQDIIGSQAVGGIAYGAFTVAGSVEAYFEDLTLLNDVINDSYLALSWDTTDADGNKYSWNIPNLKFTKGSPKATAINTDIMLPLDFEGVRDSVTNTMMELVRTPAA